jgi:two-component system nitrogen regulation response regulator GlnG
VRELENVIRRLTLLAPSNTIQRMDLPAEMLNENIQSGNWEAALSETATERLGAGASGLMQSLGPRFETVLIRAALAHSGGHKQKAAELLGWGRNTLTRKLRQLHLD